MGLQKLPDSHVLVRDARLVRTCVRGAHDRGWIRAMGGEQRTELPGPSTTRPRLFARGQCKHFGAYGFCERVLLCRERALHA